jgi:hypothetical protein
VEVGVRLVIITVMIKMRVMVVPVVVVLVVDSQVGLMGHLMVRGRRDKVSTVQILDLHGTPVVVGVRVRKVMVIMVVVVEVLPFGVTVVMVNSRR